MSHAESPLDIMDRIVASINPPLPSVPEDASWLNKSEEMLTGQEKLEKFKYSVSVAHAIAIQRRPNEDDEGYYEYQIAEREWLDNFRIKPEDLLKEFTI